MKRRRFPWGRGGQGKITKGHKDIFGGDGYVHYLDCDDSCTGVYIYQNLSNCTFYICEFYCMSVISK